MSTLNAELRVTGSATSASAASSAAGKRNLLRSTAAATSSGTRGREEERAVDLQVQQGWRGEQVLAVRGQEAWKNFPKDMFAGALLGGVAHTIVAPVERAKLLLQTQDSNMVVLDGRHPRYKGLMDCIVRVTRDEGVLSLWRGNGSSVLRYYPSLAFNFAFKDFYRTFLTQGSGTGVDKHVIVEQASASFALARAPANFLAGAMAGCTSLVFVYPLDIAHTRLAADIGSRKSRQFHGIKDFLKTIYAKDGFRGVYRGFPASLQGMVVHRSVYFGGFDTAKDYLSQENSGQIPFCKRWGFAQAATTSAGLISYPLDTVRRRMMMQAGLERTMYTNTRDCWQKIYKTEGVLAFYKGALTNMVRGTGAALILVLYDEVKNFMHCKVPSSVDAKPPLRHDTSVNTRDLEK